MQHLRDEMNQILNRAVQVGADFGDVSVVARRERIREALDAWRPTLMFYGLYNAGKSTLVNALLAEDGEPVAETADRPCTTSVEEYALGDYAVYDTPGLDAPEKHEEISKAQLEGSHVVVFVVSTEGSFDERATIEELARLWRSDRPVIVVLNDKTGADRRSPQIAGKREQMFRHLEKLTGDESVRRDLDFLLVNAATGVRARKRMAEATTDEQRAKAELLYDISGVPELSDVMLQRLVESKGEQLLVPAHQMLHEAIRETIDELRQEMSHDAESRFFTGLEQALLSVERDFVETCEVAVRALRNTLAEDLVAAMKTDAKFETFLDSYANQVTEIVQNEAKKAHRRACRELAVVDAEFIGGGDADVEFDGVADAGAGDAAGAAAVAMEGMSPAQRKQMAAKVSAFFNSPQGQNLLKKGLLRLRDWKVPGLKGRWEQTLSKWAGKIGKGIGFGIQVLALGLELYEAHKAQRMYEEQMRRRQRDMHNTSRKLARRAEHQVVTDLPDVAVEVLGPFQEFVAELKDGVQDDRDSRQRAIAELEGLTDRLAALPIDRSTDNSVTG